MTVCCCLHYHAAAQWYVLQQSQPLPSILKELNKYSQSDSGFKASVREKQGLLRGKTETVVSCFINVESRMFEKLFSIPSTAWWKLKPLQDLSQEHDDFFFFQKPVCTGLGRLVFWQCEGTGKLTQFYQGTNRSHIHVLRYMLFSEKMECPLNTVEAWYKDRLGTNRVMTWVQTLHML